MSLDLNCGGRSLGVSVNRERMCVCGRLTLSGNVVGDRCGSENEPKEQEHLWVGERSSGGLRSQFPEYRSTVLELRPRLSLKLPLPRVWNGSSLVLLR